MQVVDFVVDEAVVLGEVVDLSLLDRLIKSLVPQTQSSSYWGRNGSFYACL